MKLGIWAWLSLLGAEPFCLDAFQTPESFSSKITEYTVNILLTWENILQEHSWKEGSHKPFENLRTGEMAHNFPPTALSLFHRNKWYYKFLYKENLTHT